MFYFFKVLIKLVFFDKFEKLYLSSSLKIKINTKQIKKKIVLIETIPDYYYLSYFTSIFNERLEDCYIIGYWPDAVKSNLKSNFLIMEIFKYFRSNIFQYLLKRKWKKLYGKLGIKEFYDYKDLKKTISNKEIKKIENKSENIFKKINRKKDIFKIKMNDVHVGDLIYDTYIRFRAEPTVDINDDFIFEIIKRSNILINGFKNLIQSKNIKDLYFPFSSYVVHGIPSRLGIKLNKTVYTDGNYQYNKKLSKKDLKHVENINSFKKIFYNLKKNLKNYLFQKN